ncbi:hypothetical protein GOP47_0018048 [Adiantum capillus-veneris]|uniref:Uncharacterized protein n=1 Tax=Adiantum capillus-veneris TaxID=13818 RepID=A0A9D4UGM3_ADICA|nr:hypothetical protein GOP47_0018048 [Adiantum capillus-veneris]
MVNYITEIHMEGASSATACSPAMIHAVQHLIEKCLLFYMDREECVSCLQSNASLKPAITRIVWDELEKCNVEFFAAYWRRRKQLISTRQPPPPPPAQPSYTTDCIKENFLQH